jgi:hypothetical protein
MVKKELFLGSLALLFLNFVSAQDNSLLDRFIWFFVTGGDSFIGVVSKWVFLLFFVVFFYSITGFALSGKSNGLDMTRFFIALILGLFSSLYITQSEIYTMAQTINALAITVSFIVFLIPLFFASYLASRSLGIFGVWLQRLGWGILSSFIFIKSLGFSLMKLESLEIIKEYPFTGKFYSALFGSDNVSAVRSGVELMGGFFLIALLFISGFLFWFMFVRNDMVIDWIYRMRAKIEEEKFRNEVALSRGLQKIDAERVRR